MPPRAPVWTKDYFERSVKHAMELDEAGKPLKEMKHATIFLEGDVRVKIVNWDRRYCVVRYGKEGYRRDTTLERRFMNFRYLKEKAHAV